MRSSASSRRSNLPPRAALTLVESRLPADPFLLTRFESFYREVVELKAQLDHHSSHAHISLDPEEVHEKLLSLLDEQENQVSRTGTLLGVEMYRQAQRVMACMADEIFSGIHWPSGNAWRSLEVEMFEAEQQNGLDPAGPCIKKLELLLEQDDPAYRELAAVYFYALSLSEKEQPSRRKYLQPLYQMIGGSSGTAAEARAFPQAYTHTLAESQVAVLPATEKWWLALGAVVIVWLAVSWLLWAQLSSPLDEGLQRMKSMQETHPTSQP